MPRPYVDGGLIIGDAASFLDSQRLKGIHMAMKSGMLAAETIFEALKSRRHLRRQAIAPFRKKSKTANQNRIAPGPKFSPIPSNTACSAAFSMPDCNLSLAAAA